MAAFSAAAHSSIMAARADDSGVSGSEGPATRKRRRLRWHRPSRRAGGQLRLCSLNILDGRRNRLNAALRCIRQMNIDLAVFSETKFHNEYYTRCAEGYQVIGSQVGQETGGVAIAYRQSDLFVVESPVVFGRNVLRVTVVSGRQKWYVIGAYIPPSAGTEATLSMLQRAYTSIPNSRWPVILMGDLNVDPRNPQGTGGAGMDRRVQTDALLSTWGMKSLCDRFLSPFRRLGERWTWGRWMGTLRVRSVCDHVMTDHPKWFRNCQRRFPRFDTDHLAIVATLCVSSPREHRRYVRGRERFPLPPPLAEDCSAADTILAELREGRTPRGMDDGRQNSWISEETWRLIDMKAAARKRRDAETLRQLKPLVKRGLRRDRKERAYAAARAAEAWLDRNEIRKAFQAIKGWYREAGPRPPKPSFAEIEAVRQEHEELHRRRETTEPPIPVHVLPAAVPDGAPTDDEIQVAVRRMKTGKAAGPTGMTSEDLKEWMEGSFPTEERPPIPKCVRLWEKVCELVRLCYTEGVIPRQFCESILVLIPKAESGAFRGIALLEIMYKLVSSIINRRVVSNIAFHDSIHGSVPQRGTGTAIMEAKLLSQLRMRIDEPLFVVFIDLKKAFYSVDRSRVLRLLRQYGVGPNTIRFLEHTWLNDTMVPRQAGYHGRPFVAERGVRAGDVISPTVFNVLVDAILRQWEYAHRPTPLSELALFYVDDGAITGTDAQRVQASLDLIARGFESFGLTMNAAKTKFMVMSGGKRLTRISRTAYRRQLTGEGPTYRDRALAKVQCLQCGAVVARQHLQKHRTTKRCRLARGTYQPTAEVEARVASEAVVVTPPSAPSTYAVSIPHHYPEVVECPVPGCAFRLAPDARQKRFAMRSHFRRRHVRDTFLVLEEGILPRCPRCGLFAGNALTDDHQTSADCRRFAERKAALERSMEQRAAETVTFTVGGARIGRVRQFKYLGRILDEGDDDSYAVLRQLDRARTKWGRFAVLLRKEGVEPRAMGYFYKAIVQAILLYGSESWVVPESILQQVRSFHHRAARYLTQKHIRQNSEGQWFHPPTLDVLAEAGLFSIDEYIRRRKTKVLAFVQDRPLYAACLASKPFSNRKVWWNPR